MAWTGTWASSIPALDRGVAPTPPPVRSKPPSTERPGTAGARGRRARRRTVSGAAVTLVAAAAILVLGAGLRLHRLGLLLDRDSFDEGVYWQTLRALSDGESLYRPVFGSQPPMSQLAIYPVYRLLGSSIWSARFAGVLLALIAVVAAFTIGKRLGGRLAGLALMLLAAVDPLFVRQSRTLQAETPSLAFSLVAVAAVLAWSEHPGGRRGRVLAVVCGTALACGILSKLTGVAAVAPVAVVVVQHALARRREGWGPARSMLLIPLALVTAALVIVTPFLGQLDAMWMGVVTFHLDAADVFQVVDRPNGPMISGTLTSWLGAAGLVGAVSGVLRRDSRVAMALAWFAASVALLAQQTPVFDHHMVILVPPLIVLAAFAFPVPRLRAGHRPTLRLTAAALSVVLVLAATVGGLRQVTERYAVEQELADRYEATIYRAVGDLETLTDPGDRVLTDAPFIAAMADRDTPPNLVDVSDIRIRTGLLTAEQLIEEASAPEVRAVLFFPRLFDPRLRPFHSWMEVHFRMVRDYGGGRSLWVRR